MIFFGKYKNNVICTDNYDDNEISLGIHYEHLRSDLKGLHFPYMDIYDENLVFLKRISR